MLTRLVVLFVVATASSLWGAGAKLEARLENARLVNDTVTVDFVLKNVSKETIRLAERWNSWGAHQWRFRSIDSDGGVITWKNPQEWWDKNFLSVVEIPVGGEFRMACLLATVSPRGTRTDLAVFESDTKAMLQPPAKLIGEFEAKLESQGEVSTNWAGKIETELVLME